MKLTLLAAASVAAIAIGAGTASAQYVVPHRNHYHVVPTYQPPIYSGYSYPTYSYPSYTPNVITNYNSFGGYSSGFPYGSGFGSPGFGFGGYHGRSWGGHHHGHHHHGHHHHR